MQALLKIEQQGAVLTVGLNRPAKRNALNGGIMLAIQDCFSGFPKASAPSSSMASAALFPPASTSPNCPSATPPRG